MEVIQPFLPHVQGVPLQQSKSQLSQVGTNIVGYYCDRPDHVYMRIVERFWNFGLEKSLRVENEIICGSMGEKKE